VKASPPPGASATEQPPPSILGPSAASNEPPTTGPKTATWPEWFPSVDLAMAVMALVIAFLTASFAARNSDLWLHLANGRLIAHGDVSPGKDPFSFTGADRPWVDSSWLFDLLLYASYSADPSGGFIVVLKALGFAAAIGGFFFFRKADAAGWPWVIAAALAALASAQYASVRPVTASMVFLTVTFFVLFRTNWKEGTWRQPAILGGIFCFWANTDSWFLLGPVVLTLVALGEYLNRFITFSDSSEASWFPPTPPTKLLLRALGIGLVGCLLNPMFLAAFAKSPGEACAQLVPYEFGFGVPPGVVTDPDLVTLIQSPLDEEFWSRKFGKNDEVKLNAVAFAILVVVSALSLALGFNRIRIQHLLLWFAFGIMALLHVRLIPFFCLVAIPLTGWYLNGISTGISLGGWAEPKTRIILTASAFGRVLGVLALLAAIALAYPGWLHPPQGDPTYERVYINRVEWSIDPDPGLVRLSERLQQWRTDGTMPADFRGLGSSIELANYCAWYAPNEKVFANARFGFHREELPELLTVREIVVGKKGNLSDDVPDYEPLLKVCERHNISYLAIASWLRQVNVIALHHLLQDAAYWEAWHIDGRAAVLGYAKNRPKHLPTFDELTFDPTRLAFGPNAAEVPEGKLVPAPIYAKRSWVDDYIERPSFPPPEADDVNVWSWYSEIVSLRVYQEWQREVRRLDLQRQANSAFAGLAMTLVVFGTGQPAAAVADDQFALPILMARAARVAIANQPDRPDGYAALATAYRQPLAAVLDAPLPAAGMSERDLQIITAQSRFLDRIPPVENCPPRLARHALNEAGQLASAFEQSGQLDFARDTLVKALALAKSLPVEVLADMAPQQARAGKSNEEIGKLVLKNMEQAEERLTRITQLKGERVGRATGYAKKFYEAQEQGLPARALQIYKDADASDFGSQLLQVNVAVILMELRAGHLDQAATYIASFSTDLRRNSKAAASRKCSTLKTW